MTVRKLLIGGISTVATLLALITFGAAIQAYLSDKDRRIERLEERVEGLSAQWQAIVTVPPQMPRVSDSGDAGLDSENRSIGSTAADSYYQMCADLADRMARRIERDGFKTMAADALQDLMERLGCIDINKNE